jgi:large subunit ribosomal protein L23
MNPFILKKPVITEKTYKLAEDKVYTFEVAPKATKGQIREAVEDTFGVTVLAVQTVKIPGKTKRTGKKRIAVKASPRKKAMVRIKPDQSIELFEIKG